MKDEWEKEKKGLDVKRVKLVNDVKGLQTLVDKLLKKKWPPLATRSTSPSRVRFEAEKKTGREFRARHEDQLYGSSGREGRGGF